MEYTADIKSCYEFCRAFNPLLSTNGAVNYIHGPTFFTHFLIRRCTGMTLGIIFIMIGLVIIVMDAKGKN